MIYRFGSFKINLRQYILQARKHKQINLKGSVTNANTNDSHMPLASFVLFIIIYWYNPK